MFFPWPQLLGADIEVFAVLLPGRGRRLRERPHRRMEQLIVDLKQAIRPHIDVPYAIVGHSLGASVGFELIRALRREASPLPSHLFVSAGAAPQIPRKASPIHHLPQAKLLATLEERYGSADLALRDPEMADLLFPSIQADIEILETFVYSPEEPIPVPITACGGLDDTSVPRSSLEAWRELTSAGFSLQMFPGDHFYIVRDPAPVLAVLRDVSLR